jgi:hypothetical protein
MTPSQAKQLLPVIQAFAEGKTIQSLLGSGEWKDATDPIFMYGAERYRIKPEPKEIWLNIYADLLSDCAHKTKEEANRSAAAHRIACVKVTYTEGEGL